MAEHVIRLPDVGEGVAEAELVEWHVKVGDLVREDTLLGAVMTDKATVEIPSPVEGEVLWLGAQIGEVVAVGSELVRLRVAGDDGAAASKDRQAPAVPERPDPAAGAVESAGRPVEQAEVPGPPPARPHGVPANQPARTMPPAGQAPRPEGERPLASPAVRLQAREAGIDLRQVPGSGPAGRITHEDLDAFIARGSEALRQPGPQPKTAVGDHQGCRPAPADRREDVRRERAHPSHHLCRGSRRHGARGASRVVSTRPSGRTNRGSRSCRS